MTTTPLTEPVTTTPSADDAVHVVCCDPDTALCGTPVHGQQWAPPSATTTCPLCALAESMSCGNPDCPNRQTEADGT